MKLKIILLILTLILISGCEFTISENIPCEDCSTNIFDFNECEEVCAERFAEAKGSTILGREVKEFAGFKKRIQLGEEEEISCVCTYK